jgi:hypothetical protein
MLRIMTAAEERYREQTVAAFEDFAAGFRPSRRNPANVCRTIDGMTLSVFRRPSDGRWGWSIASAGGVRYSRRSWDDDDMAMLDLFRELDGR